MSTTRLSRKRLEALIDAAYRGADEIVAEMENDGIPEREQEAFQTAVREAVAILRRRYLTKKEAPR